MTFVRKGEHVAAGPAHRDVPRPAADLGRGEREGDRDRAAQARHESGRARRRVSRAASSHGEIHRIGQAATSKFALLPDPNPSGNFTKITQRLPVRILLTDKDLDAAARHDGGSRHCQSETTEVLAARYGPRYRWYATVTVMLGTISAMLTTTIGQRRDSRHHGRVRHRPGPRAVALDRRARGDDDRHAAQRLADRPLRPAPHVHRARCAFSSRRCSSPARRRTRRC